MSVKATQSNESEHLQLHRLTQSTSSAQVGHSVWEQGGLESATFVLSGVLKAEVEVLQVKMEQYEEDRRDSGASDWCWSDWCWSDWCLSDHLLTASPLDLP